MMDFMPFVLAVMVMTAIVWAVLNWRENRRLAKGLARHSGVRLIFAAFGLLTLLFSGGCGTLFLVSWIADGMSSGGYVTWEAIAVLSLPPFAAGLILWLIAMRRAKTTPPLPATPPEPPTPPTGDVT